MLKDRKAYETKLDEQLARWDRRLAKLKARTRETSVDAMVKYDQILDSLQRKQEEAGAHLKSLKAASDEGWEEVKTATEKVWSEVMAMAKGSNQSW
jgi:hypothetical protein